jgi:hypothetical protein
MNPNPPLEVLSSPMVVRAGIFCQAVAFWLRSKLNPLILSKLRMLEGCPFGYRLSRWASQSSLL